MAKREERYYTAEEYLALEGATPERHEYLDGRIYAMSGATPNHNRVAGNVFAALHAQLRGRRCEAFGSDMKVRVPATGLYTYPDVSAFCGEPRFDPHEQAILLNPSVIVEVLSPSTEAYDRGTKFSHYRKIESLREYVLVAQDHVRVERYTRGGAADDEWTLFETTDLRAAVDLPSIGCALALGDVYERVELVPNPPLRAVQEPDAAYAASA